MDRPIRVAEVIGQWNNYGVETLMLSLYRNVDRSKVQFDFIINGGPVGKVPTEEIESMGGRVIVVPPYTRPREQHEALVNLFKQERYAIVHSHTSTLCFFSLWAAKSAGVPVRIAHCHTMAGKGEYAKNAVKYTLRLLSHIYPTHYAASSLMAGEWLFGKEGTLESGMFYMPVARDLTLFRFDPNRRKEMRERLAVADRLVIGHLGRFVPQKNHEFLLEVFKEVRKIDDRALLLLAGNGPLEARVMNRAEVLGIAEDVLFLGQRDDAPDLYQAMDVFVLPSLYEGVPGTGIEAQAAGVPFVFASTITDEATILPSAQRLSLELGSQKWAETIIEASNSPRIDSYAEMTGAGYNIEAAAQGITDYYVQLAASVRPS